MTIVGGVILFPNEQYETKYVWGLGKYANNQDEYWALWHGLKNTTGERIKKNNSYWCSLIVIHQIYQSQHKTKGGSNPLIIHIQNIANQLEQIEFKHVLRETNINANTMPNLCVLLEIGEIGFIDGQQSFCIPP